MDAMTKLFARKDESMDAQDWCKQVNALEVPKMTLASNVPKPKTMMEMYQVTPRHIYQDMLDRPKHYTDEQQQIVEGLYLKRPTATEPTPQELDAIFYRWQEKTEQVQQRKEIMKKVTDISDRAEFEGKQKRPTFEAQNYGKLIKII